MVCIPVYVSLLVIWFVRQHFRCHVDGRANSSFVLTCPLHLGQTKIYYDDGRWLLSIVDYGV